MRKKGLVILLLAVAVSAVPALAEEVIFFTNGTVMPIRSHKVEGDQIKVDLGDNGFMAFPNAVVEKIEAAPDVVLQPSSVSNQMFTSSTSTRVYAASPRQSSDGQWELPTNGQQQATRGQVSRDDAGVTTSLALPNDPHPGARKLRVQNARPVAGSTAAKKTAKSGVQVSLPNPSISLPKDKAPFRKK